MKKTFKVSIAGHNIIFSLDFENDHLYSLVTRINTRDRHYHMGYIGLENLKAKLEYDYIQNRVNFLIRMKAFNEPVSDDNCDYPGLVNDYMAQVLIEEIYENLPKDRGDSNKISELFNLLNINISEFGIMVLAEKRPDDYDYTISEIKDVSEAVAALN